MKKYLGLFVVLAIVFSANISFVRAEDSADSTARDSYKQQREEMRKELESKREAFKKDLEAKREAAKAKMEALRESLKAERDAVKAKAKEARITGREKALERFDVAVLRMSALKDRVSEQVTKLKAKGVDTTAAEGFIATAEEKLDAAKAKIVEATNLLGTSITELTAENKTTLRTLAQETQALLKEARASLNSAVKALKEGIKAKKEAAKADKVSSENETEVEKD
ncbi:MAG: hypothetical protein WAV15_02690 [Minisyncoccia bacterium]